MLTQDRRSPQVSCLEIFWIPLHDHDVIPPFAWKPISLFGLTFEWFYVFMAIGFYLGAEFAVYRAKELGLQRKPIYDAALLALGFGIFGAHLVHILEERPWILFQEPLELFRVWSGLSSYGGFVFAGFAIFLRLRNEPQGFFPYADALSFGLAFGWFLGRIGCFSAHDHPGSRTNFVLAVAFPNGARHDLGLYEATLSLLLFIFLVLTRKKAQVYFPGWQFSLLLVGYGVFRFLLDFLRATDLPNSNSTYGGLRLSQYFSLILVITGIWIYRRASKKNLQSQKPTPLNTQSL